MRTAVSAAAFAALAFVMALYGCSPQNEDVRVSFVSKDAPIEFTFPAGWYENPEKHPYDLQCLSPSQRMNAGVFAHKKSDIVVGLTPIDVFWGQIDDLKSKRKNFQELEPIQKLEDGDKTVTRIAYRGDRDSSRNCYRVSLIEFKKDNSIFAVVLQVATLGEWEKSKSVFEEITQSARPLSHDETVRTNR